MVVANILGKASKIMRKVSLPENFKSFIKKLKGSTFVRSSIGLGGITAVDMVLGIITAILLARALGAEGLGIYSLAVAIVTLAPMPVSFGLPNLVMREVAHSAAVRDTGATKSIILFAVSVTAMMSVVLISAAILGLATLGGSVAEDIRKAFAVSILLIPSTALIKIFGGALAGTQRVVLAHLPQRLIRSACFAVALAVATLEPDWLTPARAIALQVFSSMIALIAATALIIFYFADLYRFRRAKILWGPWLWAMCRLGLSNGMKQANDQILLLLTSALAGLEEVGLLRIAQRGAGILVTGTGVFIHTAAPRMAKLYSEGSRARLQRLLVRTAQVAFILFTVGLISYSVFGQWLLKIVFGPEFVAAWGMLMVLTTGLTISSLFGPSVMLMNMVRRESLTISGHAISLFVTIIVVTALIPLLGGLAAALGRATGVVTLHTFLRHKAKRELGLDPAVFSRARS